MSDTFFRPGYGEGKSHMDFVYDTVKEIGVYTYWKWYCRDNGYYIFSSLGGIYE